MSGLPDLLPVILEYHRQAQLQGVTPEPLETTEEEFEQIKKELGPLRSLDTGCCLYCPGAPLGQIFGVKLVGIKKPPNWGHLVPIKKEGEPVTYSDPE